MIRKSLIALSAVLALGIGATLSTDASAKPWKDGGWHHKHHNHHHGHWKKPFYYGGPSYVAYDYGCWTKRWVKTPWGPKLKRTYICY